jgi:hypothetical protein
VKIHYAERRRVMDHREVTRLLDQPTISIRDAGRVVGLGMNAAYAAAKAGTIPTLAFGGKRVVPTAKLKLMLGLAA